MSNHDLGLRRAPGRLSRSFLFSLISYSVRPATEASAAILIAGAMIASVAIPASAAISVTNARATAPTAPTAVTAPLAAPAPLASPSFGTISFKGVVKPRPAVAPVAPVRTNAVVSRSTTRVRLTSAPTQPVSSGGVLGRAASLAGIYYVYGGTTPAGFDCSGFTQYVFGSVGISLPRTAEAQRQSATSVSNPQPGDLVFFGSPAYHVGIYAGNGMMWDSPHSGMAVSQRSIYSSSASFGRP